MRKYLPQGNYIRFLAKKQNPVDGSAVSSSSLRQKDVVGSETLLAVPNVLYITFWMNILPNAIRFLSCISRNYSSRNFYYHCFSCKLVRLGCENRIVFLHLPAIDIDVLEGKNKGGGSLFAFSFVDDSNLCFVVFTTNDIEIDSATTVYRTDSFAPVERERKVITQLVRTPIYI